MIPVSETSEPAWRPERQWRFGQVPPALAPWLFDPGSLTRRLQAACPGCFAVRVLGQGWQRPSRNERRRLSLRHGALAWVRQVYLLCDGQPWVFARTVIPRSTLTGPQRRLARLGSRPLGAVLFAEPAMHRDEMEVACLRPGERPFATAVAGLEPPPAVVWARRSVFYLANKPLLVSEMFLPGLGPYPTP